MVSNAGKMLLKNTIQSLEHQNKRREEREMWTKLQNERIAQRSTKRKQRDSDYHKSDDISHSKVKSSKWWTNDPKADNYWLKKLMAEEEKLSNERWTHNGFKELYSEEFQSKSSSESSEEETHKKKTKKKKKKKSKSHKKHKHKKQK